MKRKLTFLEDWNKWLLRPLVAKLLTGFVIFLISLAFAPVRHLLFPPSVIKEYPLICTAEPYVLDESGTLGVDLFIINRTGKEYSREDLFLFLESNKRDPESELSPDIELKYSRRADGDFIGRVENVHEDKEFNRGKGNLEYFFDEERNSIHVRLNEIKARAVMKVTIIVVELPDLDPKYITRMTKIAIPFDYRDYEASCYTRK